MFTLYRILAHIPLLLMLSSTAVAQDWTQELHPEFQFGALVGGGWTHVSVESYREGVSWESSQGMGVSFGASARVGFSTAAPGVGLILTLQGDLFSMSDTQERFLVGDVGGLFGLKIPVFLDGRSSVLVGGMLAVAFTDNRAVQGTGLTYGAVLGYRFDYLTLEARYQVFTFDAGNGLPPADASLTIHQLLGGVGIAL